MDSSEDPLFSPSVLFGVIDYNFFYYLYTTFGPLVSFLFLARFYALSHLQHVELSWQLKVNLVVWLFSLTFTFALYILIFGKYVIPGKLQFVGVLNKECTNSEILGLVGV
jgi:hypothetical protein